MNRYIPIALVLVFLPFLVAACTQNDEADTEEYYGLIGSGNAMGYGFTITKEESGTILWELDYKGDLIVIEKNEDNIDELVNYATAIQAIESSLSTVFYSLIYLLLVVAIALFLYARNRKALKYGGTIAVVIAGGIALYFAADASIEVNNALQEAKLYYLRLVG
ncbi:hypothetical protein M3193_14755 [Sporosarcina luteola]|uniref:hypothetical protein n=1 Tax=Sporosarcina luteola TaxID=582850 RepID=UPI00203E8D0B|nr:hypothetical protein [Sporosarcina luteola]MCM3745384.1 hypothetical protein [Sporosarcina luteola]